MSFFQPLATLFIAALAIAAGTTFAAQAPDQQAPTDAASPPSANSGVAPGHSMHGEAFDDGPRQAAYLIGGTGKVSFPISTTNALVQRFFDQGLGQLHGFWYWEAERSFRQAAALDPGCAMAYWGMAMANTNNPKRALGFVREAVKRKSSATRREMMYIEALGDYYEDWDGAQQPQAKRDEKPSGASSASGGNSAAKPADESKDDNSDSQKAADKKRKQDYLSKLEAIVQAYPDDLEAKAFFVYYRWDWRDAVPIEDREAINGVLERIFAAAPMHPAHHYKIHLWDDAKPERALSSAAVCGQSAPSIAHMWHMPGHIYSKLKRYGDAAYQQEASARVDHAYMMRDRVMPYQIHNYAHNNEWLVRNLTALGRVSEARRIAQNLVEVPRHPKLNLPTDGESAAGYGLARLYDTLTLFELWQELITLADLGYLNGANAPLDQIRRLRWVGAAHLSLGNHIQGGHILAELQKRRGELDGKQNGAESPSAQAANSNDNPPPQPAKNVAADPSAVEQQRQSLDKALAHLQGLTLAGEGNARSALPLLEKAGDLPKTHLARAYLAAGDAAKAQTLAREAVEAGKNEVYPLATLVEILYEVADRAAAAGDKNQSSARLKEAADAFEKLRHVAASSDLQAPIFDRIARIARDFGVEADWRDKVQPASDVGTRPPLESLGPLQWQPMRAPRWTLLDADEEPVSIYDYSGKPVVMIFYLGYGCLHCAEQLQAFRPLSDEFNNAGIEIVAVSTDSVADLKKALEAFSATDAGARTGGFADAFPFTLVSDADWRLFKAYGCFDDFEQQPLHGTFLLDREGLVRWQDIGPEPFKDAEFLLKEANRLLEFPR
jgi:peroxiredoxin